MLLNTVSVFLGFVLSTALAQNSTCGLVGGFAVRVPTSSCPSDAPNYCGTGLQTKCCPSGFTCYNGKYCCQGNQECDTALEAHPQCALSTESVWAYNRNGSLGWCCDSNYFGFAYLDNSGVGCQPVGQTIDTQTYHTVYQLATATPVTCSSTSTTLSTTSATSTGSQMSSGGSLTATSTSESSPLAAVQKSSSFGPGAIAGVAVGAAAVIVLIALGAWFIGRRSRKRRAAEAAAPSAYSDSHGYYPSSEKKANTYSQPTSQYTNVPVQEIGPYEPRTHQIPGTHEMY